MCYIKLVLVAPPAVNAVYWYSLLLFLLLAFPSGTLLLASLLWRKSCVIAWTWQKAQLVNQNKVNLMHSDMTFQEIKIEKHEDCMKKRKRPLKVATPYSCVTS